MASCADSILLQNHHSASSSASPTSGPSSSASSSSSSGGVDIELDRRKLLFPPAFLPVNLAGGSRQRGRGRAASRRRRGTGADFFGGDGAFFTAAFFAGAAFRDEPCGGCLPGDLPAGFLRLFRRRGALADDLLLRGLLAFLRALWCLSSSSPLLSSCAGSAGSRNHTIRDVVQARCLRARSARFDHAPRRRSLDRDPASGAGPGLARPDGARRRGRRGGALAGLLPARPGLGSRSAEARLRGPAAAPAHRPVAGGPRGRAAVAARAGGARIRRGVASRSTPRPSPSARRPSRSTRTARSAASTSSAGAKRTGRWPRGGPGRSSGWRPGRGGRLHPIAGRRRAEGEAARSARPSPRRPAGRSSATSGDASGSCA